MAALCAGCSFDRGWPTAAHASAVAFEPGRDYFAAKAVFHHSNQLSASYHGHFKRVRLVTNGIGEEFSFVLVQQALDASARAAAEKVGSELFKIVQNGRTASQASALTSVLRPPVNTANQRGLPKVAHCATGC